MAGLSSGNGVVRLLYKYIDKSLEEVSREIDSIPKKRIENSMSTTPIKEQLVVVQKALPEIPAETKSSSSAGKVKDNILESSPQTNSENGVEVLFIIFYYTHQIETFYIENYL